TPSILLSGLEGPRSWTRAVADSPQEPRGPRTSMPAHRLLEVSHSRAPCSRRPFRSVDSDPLRRATRRRVVGARRPSPRPATDGLLPAPARHARVPPLQRRGGAPLHREHRVRRLHPDRPNLAPPLLGPIALRLGVGTLP